jgi:exosortase
MNQMATMAPAPPQRLDSAQEPAGLLPLFRHAAARSEGRLILVGASGCLGLLTLVFESNLRDLVFAWSNDGNYSHGFLVPLISLYFANLAAERGPVPMRSGIGLGLAFLAASMAGRLATTLIPVGFVGQLSFILGLTGICALILGRDALRRYWFAFFFLIFMVPLPVALYAQIASPLQLMVSQVATEVLNHAGIPVLREGNMMTLPRGVRMFVAEACSGMRQLTGFLALTVAMAYLSLRPAWYRVAIVASAVPIAMTANVARVVLTGVVMHCINPEYASGAYHTAEGLLMMGLGLALLRLECWCLDQVAALCGADTPAPAPPSQERRGRGRRTGPRPLETASAMTAAAQDPPPGPEQLDGLSRSDHGRLLEQGWTV